MKSAKNVLPKSDFDKPLKFLFKSSLLIFLGISFSKIFTYLFRIVISRNYGPEVYGIYSLALIILSLFVAISSLGLSGGLLRYVPQFRAKNKFGNINYVFRKSLVYLLVMSVLMSLCMYLLSDFIAVKIFHEQDLAFPLKIFSILIPFWVFSSAFQDMVRSFERPAQYSFLVNILPVFSRTLILILLVLIGMNSNAVYFSFGLSLIIMLFGSFLAMRSIFKKFLGYKKKINSSEKSSLWRSFFSYSWPLVFITLVTRLYDWTGSLSIGYFLDARSVGLYNAAVPIALLLGFSTDIFSRFLFTLINIEYSKGNINNVKYLSQQVAKWILFVNIPILLLIITFPELIISVLFGEVYVEAANALRILVIGQLFFSISGVSEKLILMQGKTRFILWNIITNAILSIILNIILIPKYGISGAALATTIVLITFTISLMMGGRRFSGVLPIRKDFIRLFLISLVPFIIVLLLKSQVSMSFLTLILMSSTYILVYILLLFTFKGFDKRDYMIISSIKKKLTKKIVANNNV